MDGWIDGWKTALARKEGIPDNFSKTEGVGGFSSDPCERKGEKHDSK